MSPVKDSLTNDKISKPINPEIKQCHGNSGDVCDQKFAIVVSQYHQNITGNLLHGAIDTLKQNNVPDSNIKVFWVPGAWELISGSKMALQGRFDAVLAFGCVIRGETTHDQYINSAVSNSLGQLTLAFDAEIAFGLLTCNTLEQAIARSGGDVGNKGVEVANAAIQMLLLRKEFLD